MAQILPEVSRTFNEFLLLPNRTSAGCSPDAIDLSVALARHADGEPPSLTLSVPFTSAIMQAVSSPQLAISLACSGGLGFLSHNQGIEAQAAAVRQVKYADHQRLPGELVDAGKRLRVGAGVNTHDFRDRIPALVEAGADVLCFDSSDGYSDWQADALRWSKREFPAVPVGGGNVVDGQAFTFLAEAGADFVKVGIGGGSICITRDQKGIGRGQASAVLEVAGARDAYRDATGMHVPVCSDGGLLHDYHMALALAMGADFVMMGHYFARFDQAPGRKVRLNGAYLKEYWGEGSRRARNWQRYDQGGEDLVFEEGVDGYVPYAGDLTENLAVTTAKIRATMASCGARTLAEFRETARLVEVSEQTYQENVASVIVRESVGAVAD